MKNKFFAVIFGFIIIFIVNTILALLLIGPLFNKTLGVVRTEEQGLNFPAILIGYLIIALLMAWLISKINILGWLKRGLVVGALTGVLVFGSGHMIIAGWSVIDSTAMIVSGWIDALSTLIGGVVISYFLNKD